VNSVPPSIPGHSSVVVGSVLKTTKGTWYNNPTSFKYQWYSVSGNNIKKKILNQTAASYKVSPRDIGLKILHHVVASNAGGSSAPKFSNQINVVPPPPANTVLPSIPGSSGVVGSVLKTSTGTWSNNPTSFAYQWYSANSASGTSTAIPILNQTAASYTTVSPGDIGLTITCKVVATNAGGSSAPATSNPIVVLLPPPANIVPPSIPGSSWVVGSTITTSTGTWSNNPTSFTYQWYSANSASGTSTAIPIPNQTTASYTTVSPGDIGSTITCNVGATNAPATSNPIVVLPPPTILQYNNSNLGSSFSWGGVNFTLDTSSGLPPNSYTGNPFSIPGTPVNGFANLIQVIIGNSVTSIGTEAFFGCTALTSIIIPNSVTSIGINTFLQCSALTSVTIGNSVTIIGGSAFASCSALTSIIIPNSVTSISNYAFQACSALTSVTIGNSVASIGGLVFFECIALATVTIAANNQLGITSSTPNPPGTNFFGTQQDVEIILLTS
jgi:hypothetical protein